MHTADTITKKRIAFAFNRAVDQYDHAACLQRSVAKKLLFLIRKHLLASPFCMNQCILEIGVGTGYLTNQLLALLWGTLVGIDIAEKMVKKTLENLSFNSFDDVNPYALKKNHSHIFAADGDKLPFRDLFFKAIISNLSLQWSPSLLTAFSEYYRVLETNGMIIFSTFGPQTLTELRQCWESLDKAIHVNHFISKESIEHDLINAGFKVTNIYSLMFKQFYPDVMALMKQLKALGANHIIEGRTNHLMGKSKFHRLEQLYEQYCMNNIDSDLTQLFASFEVIFVVAQKAGM